MAKTRTAANGSTSIATLARSRGGALRAQTRAAAGDLAAVAADAALASVADVAVAAQDKVKKLWDQAKTQNGKANKATVDMAGSITGVLSFEGLNWMVRYLGEKFEAIGGSVDYWQSIPHLVIGLVAYWGELLTRKSPVKDGAPIWPSMPRQIASEWAKVFILLGAHNLIRALRVRRKDAKLAADQLVAVQAELAKAKAQLQQYETPQTPPQTPPQTQAK